ncbi:exopolysaccharide biosynthesis polyprenyl glycosylphosphotransferase [bacterium]|nr:exopolysaccharide biosynthesis polyprenyl glycosylphosphotransferase [bacterium]
MKQSYLLTFIDFFVILASFVLGYIFRFYSHIFPEKGIPPFSPYLKLISFTVPGYLFIFNSVGIYREKLFANFVQEFSSLIKGCVFSVILLFAGTFLYRGFSYSRLAIGFSCLFSFFLLWIFHYLFFKLKKPFAGKIIVMGKGKEVEVFMKRIAMHQKENIEIDYHPEIEDKLIENLSEKNKKILVASPSSEEESVKLIKKCQEKNINLYILPKVHQFYFSGEIESVDGVPLFSAVTLPIEKFPASFYKRSIDIFFGFIIFMIFLIFLPPIAFVIKLTSKGPVFFRQKRIGYKGKIFKIYKFRTMKDTEIDIPYTLENDPRITKIGKFLRRFFIDEIPQIMNVLNGEMSIVGPRPISVEDKFFISQKDFDLRLRAKPGITGWAQIHGLRGGHREPFERFQYDLFYIENWNIWLDLAIVLLTPFSIKNEKRN